MDSSIEGGHSYCSMRYNPGIRRTFGGGIIYEQFTQRKEEKEANSRTLGALGHLRKRKGGIKAINLRAGKHSSPIWASWLASTYGDFTRPFPSRWSIYRGHSFILAPKQCDFALLLPDNVEGFTIQTKFLDPVLEWSNLSPIQKLQACVSVVFPTTFEVKLDPVADGGWMW